MADEVDELYALPLDEFTSARNELAKHSGDTSIKSLKKPSVVAWAVNQLARKREVDLRRLLRAGEQLEAAQRKVVGGGDQRAFEQARREEREAVRRLRGEAAALLEQGGHPASDATLERVAKTLHAAAASEDGRAIVRAGRLTEELEPQGFDALAAVAASLPARAKRPARAKERSDARRERARMARAEADEARTAAEEARNAASEAERALEEARRAAKRAADRADRLDDKARKLESP